MLRNHFSFFEGCFTGSIHKDHSTAFSVILRRFSLPRFLERSNVLRCHCLCLFIFANSIGPDLKILTACGPTRLKFHGNTGSGSPDIVSCSPEFSHQWLMLVRLIGCTGTRHMPGNISRRDIHVVLCCR